MLTFCLLGFYKCIYKHWSLLGKQSVEALFAARDHGTAPRPLHPSGSPTQVEIDNATSDRFTIVEVFADDRQGLLYKIARTLFELELSIASAKISTSLDQIADAFYVTDRGGAKITDEARLGKIRLRLIEAIPAPQPARS